MVPGERVSQPEKVPALASPQAAGMNEKTALAGWGRLLDGAIFSLFVLFAICLPHSIKGAQNAWKLAFILWLVKLAMERKRPFDQPLAAPLLAYVTLSGISAALSPDPYLSWDRMKIVCLVLVGIVVAQNLKRLSQVRILVFLLILSGLAAAGFTAWQYTYGVGVQVKHILGGTPLSLSGVRTNDIITAINGEKVHSAAQLEHVVLQSSPDAMLHLEMLRGYPFQKERSYIRRDGFMRSGFGTPNLQFGRGKPFRAQGTLGHYIVFAEMLMQIGCMTWAMMLSVAPRKRALQVFLAITFLALTAAMLATEARATVAGLAVGCMAALLILAGKRWRVAAACGLAVLLIAAGLWIQHRRGINWTDTNDPGTNFRMLMWADGVRLVKQHPWFGVGMETVRLHFQEWNIRGFLQYHVISHFHSTLLQIAVERGLPTLAAWLWFVIAYLIFLVRLLRRTSEKSRFATGVVAGVLGGFLAFQTTSLVHYNLGEESLVMVLFFYFGLAVAIDRMLREPYAINVP